MPRRVLALVPPDRGAVAYYRFFQPFEALRPRGWDLATLPPQTEYERTPAGVRLPPSLLDGIDLLLFPQTVLPIVPAGADPDAVLAQLLDEADRRGIPAVYNTDDAVGAVDARNPAFAAVAAHVPLVHRLLARVRAVIVTTAGLADLLRPAVPPGTPVHVLPNAIDPARIRPRPRTSGEWRVGWAGGASHADNLLMVLPALRAVCRRHPVRPVVYGLFAEPLAQAEPALRAGLDAYTASARLAAVRLLDLAAALRELGAIHLPYGPLDAYFRALPALDLDIGLCPLLDTPFNRGKSALKYYEYAAAGTLALASDVPPFAGEATQVLPPDPGAWADAIEHWLRRPDERAAETARQRAWVLAERSAPALSDRWDAVLGSVLT